MVAAEGETPITCTSFAGGVHAAEEAGGGRHDDGAAGVLPDSEIGRGVSGVVEALRAELRHKEIGLVHALEVVCAVGGVHAVEQVQMRGNIAGDSGVGGGDEVDGTVLCMGFPGQRQDVFVIDERCRIERDGRRRRRA